MNSLNLTKYKVKPRAYLRIVTKSGVIFMGQYYYHPFLAALEGQFVSVHLTEVGPQIYQLGPGINDEHFLCTLKSVEFKWPSCMEIQHPQFTRNYALEG